jgi:macrodomain Ter protein organizer (MatP/YcbG family)
MTNSIPVAPLPVLPVYEKPAEKVKASLPKGLEITKMPSTMNKMISKMLVPKMKAKLPKLKTSIRHRTNTRFKSTTKTKKKGIQIA